ncbi:MAG: hypothetical protein Q4E59_00730 [Bacteroidales bacterium]|nr:hypothetical protein [Bacteroidales bacterium]
MTYTIDDLSREVRVAIDQNMLSTALAGIGDPDTLAMNDIIKQKLPIAARIVESSASFHLLDSGRAFGDSIRWHSYAGLGSGEILLPDDFLRLVCFQMSDWDRAVTTVVREDSELYAMQQSRYPGVRGNPQDPVVAITSQPAGLVLEFYSCTAGSDVFVRRARYIPIPRVVDGNIELCEKLVPAIVNYAGYLTVLTYGESGENSTIAANLLNQAKELMT